VHEVCRQLHGAKVTRGCIEFKGNVFDFERNWLCDVSPETAGDLAGLRKYEYEVSIFPILTVDIEHQRQLARDVRAAMESLRFEHDLWPLWSDNDDV
jgi:hypothetical protein